MLRIVASCKAAFLVEQIVPSQESKCEKKLIIDSQDRNSRVEKVCFTTAMSYKEAPVRGKERSIQGQI